MGHGGCHLYSIVHAASLLIATLETLRCCRHHVAILLFVAGRKCSHINLSIAQTGTVAKIHLLQLWYG